MKHAPLSKAELASPILQRDLEHGQHVEHLCTLLFDGLASLHRLSPKWRKMLRAAARLHDIGWIYGQVDHHKTSARMIRANSVEKLSDSSRPLVAIIARYHRKSLPSTKHKRFAKLDEKTRTAVSICASLLRLADALDYDHAGHVQSLQISIHVDKILLELYCPKGCLHEIRRVPQKSALFEHLFTRTVECQCTQITTAVTNKS